MPSTESERFTGQRTQATISKPGGAVTSILRHHAVHPALAPTAFSMSAVVRGAAGAMLRVTIASRTSLRTSRPEFPTPSVEARASTSPSWMGACRGLGNGVSENRRNGRPVRGGPRLTHGTLRCHCGRRGLHPTRLDPIPSSPCVGRLLCFRQVYCSGSCSFVAKNGINRIPWGELGQPGTCSIGSNVTTAVATGHEKAGNAQR